MNQSSLFDEAPQPVETLFFALVPPPGVAQRMRQLASGLQQRHGLAGRLQDADRLHLSLHGLGEYAGLPPGLQDRAGEAAALVRSPPFDLTLDTTLSFARTQGSRALVLSTQSPPPAFAGLHSALALALARCGLGRHAARAIVPHVTLLYDHRMLPQEAAPPLTWTVEHFVLVHSLPGQHRHTHLGRWPLRG